MSLGGVSRFKKASLSWSLRRSDEINVRMVLYLLQLSESINLGAWWSFSIFRHMSI